MIKKIILGIIIVIILFIGGFIIYIQINWDKKYDIAYPDLKISTDSSVIAWGKYLVRGPAHCSNCHVSSYQELILSDQGKDIPLKGGVKFPLGPLGIISPANLTKNTLSLNQNYTQMANPESQAENVDKAFKLLVVIIALLYSIMQSYSGLFWSSTPEISLEIQTMRNTVLPVIILTILWLSSRLSSNLNIQIFFKYVAWMTAFSFSIIF